MQFSSCFSQTLRPKRLPQHPQSTWHNLPSFTPYRRDLNQFPNYQQVTLKTKSTHLTICHKFLSINNVTCLSAMPQRFIKDLHFPKTGFSTSSKSGVEFFAVQVTLLFKNPRPSEYHYRCSGYRFCHCNLRNFLFRHLVRYYRFSQIKLSHKGTNATKLSVCLTNSSL
jgi:hypothetical protein